LNTLFVLLGPTGVGKTALSVRIAKHLGSPVISADSRQIYKELPVGTAAPSEDILSLVKHYFIATRSISEYYSASLYEEEAIELINSLHLKQPDLLLCGGSMMYIDAVCKGIDEMPTVTPEIRQAVWDKYNNQGLISVLEELKKSDPVHYDEVDRMNHRRVIHAVEICRMTGKPYSSFRTQTAKKRAFNIHKIGLMRERQDLFDRINHRTDEMLASGFINEALTLSHLRHLNALNTVGYKELFQYFDGLCTLDEAAEKIKRNTRIYARKQLTWFRHDPDIHWFHPDNEDGILSFCDEIRKTVHSHSIVEGGLELMS